MRQSNIIFGTLLFMFVVYITMRGQLPAWLDLFKKKQTGEGSNSGGGGDGKKSLTDRAKDFAVDAAKAYLMGQ